MTAYDRGDINGGHSAITTLAFAQDWDLDQLNNWSGFDEDTDGNATNDLVQDRTHNDANEITAITASTGANWVDPTHDAAGNMITGPTPGAETTTQKYVYDAWNRLVKVTDGSDVTVLTHGYDARNFRITKGVYTSGSLSYTRHYYHTDQNQVLEERIGSSTDPNRQYTWGDRYVDDLLLRTRDTDSNGSLDETVYALHDANWSITALADTSGSVVERFRYDAYGRAAVLDADFSADGDGISDYLWEYRFTSRDWDAESGLHYFRARYYECSGGRFLQRDQVGYADGMNLNAAYFVPGNVDPLGTELVPYEDVPKGLPGLRCVATMADHDGKANTYWEAEANHHVYGGISAACSGKDILKYVEDHGVCCTLFLIGHRGGPGNPGGMTSYCGGKATKILPDKGLEKGLLKAFKKRCCKECSIFIFACGSTDPNVKTVLTSIAKATGCTVCGTTAGVLLGVTSNITGQPNATPPMICVK